jgi:glycosyl transferase family 1
MSDAAALARVRKVLFHRDFQRFQGGHLKVLHYFEHVRSSPAYEAYIRFTPSSVWDETNPWLGCETIVAPGEDFAADVLFLAGTDWRCLTPAQQTASSRPLVNLVQAMRFTRPVDPFSAHRAIRICVSPELQEAVEARGAAGPVFTVPIGLDLDGLPASRGAEQRDLDCVVLAVKDRELGAGVARRLRRAGRSVLLVQEPIARDELLAALARARVSVHLPARIEGAYLPALESMALGAAVVCPDCVGNRSFCRDRETCLVPAKNEAALASAALELLAAAPGALAPMLAAASAESGARSLLAERAGFLEILARAEELWDGA